MVSKDIEMRENFSTYANAFAISILLVTKCLIFLTGVDDDLKEEAYSAYKFEVKTSHTT